MVMPVFMGLGFQTLMARAVLHCILEGMRRAGAMIRHRFNGKTESFPGICRQATCLIFLADVYSIQRTISGETQCLLVNIGRAGLSIKLLFACTYVR